MATEICRTILMTLMQDPTTLMISRQVGHTTAETVALVTGCATVQNNTILGLVT
jgi:hypothetical protein